MDRNRFPYELGIGALVLAGLLYMGSNISPDQFRSEKPDIKKIDPMMRAQVQAEYKLLENARVMRKEARDGAPVTESVAH